MTDRIDQLVAEAWATLHYPDDLALGYLHWEDMGGSEPSQERAEFEIALEPILARLRTAEAALTDAAATITDLHKAFNPRTAHTAEDLDALPADTVIRDADGDVMQKGHDGIPYGRWSTGWWSTGNDDDMIAVTFPAAILYVPPTLEEAGQ